MRCKRGCGRKPSPGDTLCLLCRQKQEQRDFERWQVSFKHSPIHGKRHSTGKPANGSEA